MGLNKTVLAQIIGSMGGPSFAPQSIVMEGDQPAFNTVLRAEGLTGVSNSPFGSLSFFMQPLYNTTVDQEVSRLSSGSVYIRVDTEKRLRVRVSAGASQFAFRSVSPVTPASAESHYAIAWDTNRAAGEKIGIIVKDGASMPLEIVSDTSAAFSGTLAAQYMSIGSTDAAALLGAMTLREFMYWPGAFIDWTNPANLAKVYAVGAPVNPGANGELVTGTAPAVYLSLRGNAAASTFLTNRGTGGDFSQRAGTPTIRADRTIIAYGDSLVFGTGASTWPSKSWLMQCARTANTPRRTLNYGVGGEGTGAIRSRFVAAVAGHYATYGNAPIWIIQGGYNSLAGTSAAIIAEFQAMVDALIAVDPDAKFLVLGICNSQPADQQIGGAKYIKIQEVGAALTTMVGARYFDWRQWLVDNGLAAAGLTATADDLTDIATGVVPRSLRSPDLSVHHNDFGHLASAIGIRQKIQSLGYD